MKPHLLAWHSFLQKADHIVSSSVPSLQGHYLKQLTYVHSDYEKEPIEKDNEEVPHQCHHCGIFYGPMSAKWKVKSKWKKKKSKYSGDNTKSRKQKCKRKKYGPSYIEIKCNNCKSLVSLPLGWCPRTKYVFNKYSSDNHSDGVAVDILGEKGMKRKRLIDSPAEKYGCSTPKNVYLMSLENISSGSSISPLSATLSKSAKKNQRNRAVKKSTPNKSSRTEVRLLSFLSSV